MAIEPVTIDGEIWRDIPGTDGNYQVSNLGRARRIRILTPVDHHAGRLVVTVHEKGRSRVRLLNRLVCEIFHGPPDLGMQAAHLNGNHKDNRAENLAWATPKENTAHKLLHGTYNRGEQHNQAVLSEADVMEIRSKRWTPPEKRALARKFGVAYCTIADVIARRSWSHIP